MSYAPRPGMSTRQVCLLLALAACGGHESPAPRAPVATSYPPVEMPSSATAPTVIDPAVLERGTYVANVAGCATCHTPFDAQGNPDRARLFGGGGVDGAPNISPDPATGIGTWTEDQIV